MGQGGDYGSGDAQHYQNILLSGVDQNGEDITNEVTFLVLDIMEELGISDFPTTLRINENSDEKLLRRAAEVVRFGGGILAFYNESLILKSLTDYGYPASDAWKFANDGCWEVQIPGKTFFRYTRLTRCRSSSIERWTDIPRRWISAALRSCISAILSI